MTAHGRNIAISVLFTLFGGPGILLIFVPWAVTRFRVSAGEPFAVRVLCLILIAAGLYPLLESIWRFIFVGKGTLMPVAPPKHLVVSGLYRFVRNPMYVGVLTAIAGEALLMQSRGLIIEFLISWLAFELFVRFYEEPRLARSFPEEFLLYRRYVHRWIPRLTPWEGSGG